jgi:hypothetical protein
MNLPLTSTRGIASQSTTGKLPNPPSKQTNTQNFIQKQHFPKKQLE